MSGSLYVRPEFIVAQWHCLYNYNDLDNEYERSISLSATSQIVCLTFTKFQMFLSLKKLSRLVFLTSKYHSTALLLLFAKSATR